MRVNTALLDKWETSSVPGTVHTPTAAPYCIYIFQNGEGYGNGGDGKNEGERKVGNGYNGGQRKERSVGLGKERVIVCRTAKHLS